MDLKSLRSDADGLRKDIARLKMEMKAGSAKNTHEAGMKKRELAVLLTVIREKEAAEKAEMRKE